MRRRKSREFALQILFTLENQEPMPSDANSVKLAVQDYLQNFAPRDFEEISDVPFLQRLLTGILAELPALDAEIEKHSEHWKLYRMTRIDRNILRIGASELKHLEDIPPKVAIDEAVELAKRFGTEDSSAFVNGILDKVKHSTGRGDE